MAMEEYLLVVPESAAKEVAGWLMLTKAPTHIRLAALAPLSAYGYPPGTEGHLLRIDQRGIIVGVPDREEIPRDFIPWGNIAYITDGTALAKDKK